MLLSCLINEAPPIDRKSHCMSFELVSRESFEFHYFLFQVLEGILITIYLYLASFGLTEMPLDEENPFQGSRVVQ